MELLDDVNIEKRKKPIFSILAIAMISLFTFMMYYVGSTIDKNEQVENEMTKAIISVSFLILAIMCSIISFIRKEKSLILKVLPAAVILLFVIALAVSIAMGL